MKCLLAAQVNKRASIKILSDGIAYAKTCLAVEGQMQEYYDWHNKTIEVNARQIEDIKAAPDTDWN